VKIGGDEDQIRKWESKIALIMDQGIKNTCENGPLRKLKNKINSFNINSRAPSFPYV